MTTQLLTPPSEGKIIKASPGFLVKADQNTGIVDAIVSVFGVIDYGRDIIHPGAFTKTIVERSRKIRVVDQHNTHSVLCVIGKPLEMREIGREELPHEILVRYPSAKGGLWTRTQYLLNTPEGKGAFDRIAAGAIDEYSIGYEPLDTDYGEVETDEGKVRVRNIRTIKLWEFSPVIWGMNPATATVGVKMVDGKEMTVDGPIQRLGDYLHGTVAGVFTSCTTWLYTSGVLTEDQWKSLNASMMSKLSDFRSELPEEIGLLPLGFSGYYMLGGDPEEMDTKAGRTLSAANAAQITTAFEALETATSALESVLENAGLLGAEETSGEDEAEEKSDDTPQSEEPSAGPPAEDTHRISREALEQRAHLLTRRLALLGEASNDGTNR